MKSRFDNYMRRIAITGLLLITVVGIAAAQTAQDSTEEDPFKNDPFFSAPVSDFFKSDTDSTSTTRDRDDRNSRMFISDLNEEGLDYRGVFEAGPQNSNVLYSVYPNLPMIHYNRVNALFLGISQERMQWHHDDDWLGIRDMQLHGLLGYSTGQKEWQYSIGLDKLLGKRNYFMLGGQYHNAATTNDDWRVGLNETTLTAFAGGYDYLDYYKQKGWGLYFLARSKRFFEGGIAFSDDRFTSMQKETNWALFGAGDRFRPNPPVDSRFGFAADSADITALTVSASFNPRRLVISPNFTFSLNGMAEFADPGIGTDSDFDYAKYTGELISYINFEPGGVLKYRLRMSSITGQAPRFKQLYLGGVGTLRALPYKSMGAGNQMLLSNLEMQFGNPLHSSSDWIDFDDFYLTLFLDSGWTDYDASLTNAKSPFSGLDRFDFDDLKHNAGIGAGSSLIRCELAWDLNDVDRAPVFWIRFNPTF